MVGETYCSDNFIPFVGMLSGKIFELCSNCSVSTFISRHLSLKNRYMLHFLFTDEKLVCVGMDKLGKFFVKTSQKTFSKGWRR